MGEILLLVISDRLYIESLTAGLQTPERSEPAVIRESCTNNYDKEGAREAAPQVTGRNMGTKNQVILQNRVGLQIETGSNPCRVVVSEAALDGIREGNGSGCFFVFFVVVAPVTFAMWNLGLNKGE